MNHDLTQLEWFEELWVWRNRRGLTQAGAADRLGVCCETYSRAEQGLGLLLKARWDAGELPGQRLRGAPTLPEQLFLARRRSNLSTTQAADLLGVSRPTLWAFEQDGRMELVSFWVGRGFVFSHKN